MKKIESPDSAKIVQARSDEAGIALITVALVLLLLTGLLTTAYYTMVSQTISTGNYRTSTQAYYIAEAGLQRTIDWFSHQYNAPTDWSVYGLQTDKYPNVMVGSGTPATTRSV